MEQRVFSEVLGVDNWNNLVHDRDKWRNMFLVVKTLRKQICPKKKKKKILIIINDTFYKAVMRLKIMYGSECQEANKEIKQRMNISKMRMLRWTSATAKNDNIINKCIKGSIHRSGL